MGNCRDDLGGIHAADGGEFGTGLLERSEQVIEPEPDHVAGSRRPNLECRDEIAHFGRLGTEAFRSSSLARLELHASFPAKLQREGLRPPGFGEKSGCARFLGRISKAEENVSFFDTLAIFDQNFLDETGTLHSHSIKF
ncbi:MAG: hypothetical protein WBL39_13590 [Terrimicrobiaceae bacterium]